MTKALIAVDVQHDFLPGGALAVPEGDRVLEPLAREMREGAYDVVFCSRDWHPYRHCSFVDQGGRWPAHCVAYSAGANVHETLHQTLMSLGQRPHWINKGIYQNREAYSAFDGTYLRSDLSARGVTEVVIGGLATDYCVRATVLDALRAGFDTTVLVDAVAAVDPDNELSVLEELAAAGAELATTYELERSVWE